MYIEKLKFRHAEFVTVFKLLKNNKHIPILQLITLLLQKCLQNICCFLLLSLFDRYMYVKCMYNLLIQELLTPPPTKKNRDCSFPTFKASFLCFVLFSAISFNPLFNLNKVFYTSNTFSSYSLVTNCLIMLVLSVLLKLLQEILGSISIASFVLLSSDFI